jgi:hypothetical protein
MQQVLAYAVLVWLLTWVATAALKGPNGDRSRPRSAFPPVHASAAAALAAAVARRHRRKAMLHYNLRGFTTALAGTLCALLLAGCTDGDRVASPALEFKQPSFKRIVIVVLENENEQNAIEQPFMKRLAARGAYLGSFEAITHPSQPNYIAMVAGDVHGVEDDGNVDLDVRHLGDLLEARGLRWKVYAEGYPGKCRLDGRIGPYVRKHVPFLSFKNVQSDPARCAKIVNASELYDDIAAGTLPEYALYIPDRNNDGHDTDVAFADRWLEVTFGPLLDDPRFIQDTLLVVTFDESKHFGGNRIYTAFYGDSVIEGTVSEHPWNHYSVLRTIEESFQLGTLGLNDQSAEPIGGIWR